MFAPLKSKYNQLCSDFMSENRCHNVTRQTWPSLFAKAWGESVTALNMVGGFVSTGICPFNPKAIPDTAFLPSTTEASQMQTQDDNDIPDSNATKDGK